MTRRSRLIACSFLVTVACGQKPKTTDPGAGTYTGYYGETGGASAGSGGGGAGSTDGAGDGASPRRPRDTTGTQGAAPRAGKKLSPGRPPKGPQWVRPLFRPLPKFEVAAVVPSFVPAGGVVRITGGGFVPDASKNQVVVGGVRWEVMAASEGEIVARAPAKAKSGMLEVKAGKASAKSPVRIDVVPADSTFARSAPDADHGLVANVYDLGKEVTELPNFGEVGTPLGTIHLPDLAAAPGTFAGFPRRAGALREWFALHARGSLNVEAAGEYELCLESDDGAQLHLEGQLAVDNDGAHGLKEACSVLYLDTGEYRTDVLYFQAKEGVGLTLRWAKDGGAKQVVPASAFFTPE